MAEQNMQAVDSSKAAELAGKLSGLWVNKRTSEEIKADLTPVVSGLRDAKLFNFYIRLVCKDPPTRLFTVRRYHLPRGFLPRSLRQHGQLGVREEDVDDFLHDLRSVCRCSAIKLLQFRQLEKMNPSLPFLHKSVRVLGINGLQFKLTCNIGQTMHVVTFAVGYKWTALRPTRLSLHCEDVTKENLEPLREAALEKFQMMPLQSAIEEIAGIGPSD